MAQDNINLSQVTERNQADERKWTFTDRHAWLDGRIRTHTVARVKIQHNLEREGAADVFEDAFVGEYFFVFICFVHVSMV